MTEHPDRFMLERYCVGDLPPATHARTLSHIEGCRACKERVSSFEREAEQIRADLPRARFLDESLTARDASERAGQDESEAQPRANHRPSRLRLLAAGAGFVALAAAAAFALVPRPADTIALRGAGMQVHRNRGGIPKQMGAGDRIRAGDALRVVMTLPRPTEVDAWSVDAKGRVDHWTAGPLHLETGEQTLPDSQLVETPCVDMWIVIGLGAAATQTEAELSRLGGHSVDAGDDWVPKGCLARPLRCE